MRFEPGFLASVAVILIAARLLGEGAQRLGQPAVIGQLAAGVLLGPTVFGLLWPAAQHELFPPGPAERAPLQAFAEFGILLLLVLTGMEVDLRLLRKVGRPAISVSLAGVAAPFACGAAVGFLLPDGLLPKPEERLATALFLGVALSISSIKIVASVVRDMGFARRDLGQTLVAASIVEDSIGWILLAVILGVVGARGGPAGGAAQSAVGVAAFLGVSLTVGRPLVAHLIRAVNDEFQSEFMVLSLILAIAIAFALATQALGVQTVLGAFVAGVLVGESPILTGRVAAQLRAMVSAFFAPVFFALAGLNADLTVLKSPKILALTAALLLAASFGKFLGAFVGGAIGRLTRAESLALAIGMNARGSTEVIVASIGLTTGALTPSLYAMIVAMAALTTCAMPPTLRWALARVPLRLGERERLEREALEARGFVTNMERFLVLADDQRNGRLASRVGGLLTGARGQPVTALHVESPPSGRDPDATRAPAIASDLREGVDLARLALRDNSIGSRQLAFKAVGETKTFETAVSEEARKGHDFLIIGLDPGNARQGGFAAEIASAVRSFSGPAAVAIARGVHERDPARNPLNIVVPVTGDANARHAAEVAIELARVCGGELTIFSISSAGGRQLPDSRRRALASRHNQAALKEIVEIADKRGQRVRVRNRSGGALSDVILSEAELAQATLIVFGASVRPSEALLFGETANELLEESPRSLLFVAS